MGASIASTVTCNVCKEEIDRSAARALHEEDYVEHRFRVYRNDHEGRWLQSYQVTVRTIAEDGSGGIIYHGGAVCVECASYAAHLVRSELAKT